MRNRALVFFALLLLAVPTVAKIGTIDVVPSATLLFPYFETDVNNPNGVNTLLTVQNASATAILAHVTLWTDYAVPTATFNIYLTGYDTATLDMREILHRVLPVTASDGQDWQDDISPQGPLSQDINFASCTGLLPDTQENFVSPSLAAAHRGLQSVDYFGPGNCGGFNYGDGISRGFVTVDTVNNCTYRNAKTAGYFMNSGTGDATNQNVMLGDYVIRDIPNDRVFADNAVHIEASAVDPQTQNTQYTFYALFAGTNGKDNREPLPTAWAGRYSANRTVLGYWRDPGLVVAPFPCGGTPSGFPLPQKQIRAYGTNGNIAAASTTNRFPIVAGETPVSGTSGLALTPPLGWVFLNLNLPTDLIRQSWISFENVPAGAPLNTAAGYTVPGIALGRGTTDDNPTLP
jgi:hypothetical protein